MTNKLKIFSLIVLTAATCLFSLPAFALDLNGGLTEKTATKAGYAPATDTTFASTMGTVAKVALTMAGTIFVALIFYAGYLWMTAHGETDPVDKAKTIIKTSIIGLVIALGAYSISNFVVQALIARTLQ